MGPTPSPADIRHANELACIQVLRSTSDYLTIADIARRGGMSRPTAEAVVTDLVAAGILSAASAHASGAAGRPARRFRLEHLSAVVAGVDAGPTHTTVLIGDLGGRIVGRADSTIASTSDANERMTAVVDTIRAALDNADVNPSRLKTTCVGVSGIIGVDGKIAQSYYVPQWGNTDLARYLSHALGCPVMLENDTKLMAFAEHHLGAAQLAPNTLHFRVGPHVSFALTIDGRIHQGAHRSSGELASLRGFKWTSNAVKGDLTWKSGTSTQEALAAAAAGDPNAKAEIAQFLAEIAQRIATVSLVFDPDLIVVGGEFPQGNPSITERLREEVRRIILLDAKPNVIASPVEADATAIGALALGYQDGSQELFGIPGVPVPRIDLISPALSGDR
ncbi:ROK family protein [Microbacterium sp. A588]